MEKKERELKDSRPTVGRLAPSPTGGLHLGHARTFLVAWLAARHAGGRVILRIEDLDASRVRAEARRTALDDLRWLGLTGTKGPTWRSIGPLRPVGTLVALRRDPRSSQGEREHLSLHLHPGRHRAAASAPHPEDEGPTYPGTAPSPRGRRDRPGRSPLRLAISSARRPCRLGRPLPGPSGARAVTGRRRFRRRTSHRRPFLSARRRGRRRRDGCEPGDPGRRPGAEHSPADPALPPAGRPEPRFGHVPLAVMPDGRRLAKRDGSLKLAALRDAGVDPRRLVGSLIHSCGWSREIIPMALATRSIASTRRCSPRDLGCHGGVVGDA